MGLIAGIAAAIETSSNDEAATGGSPFEYTPIDNNYSMEFDGTNYIDCGDFSVYDTGDLSFSIWVYKTVNLPNNQYVFSSSGASAKAGIDVAINRYDSVAVARRTMTADADTGYVASVGFTLNNWHHIVGTYEDSTKTIKLYVDGVLKDTTVGSASTNSASNNLTIGAAPAPSNFFIGKIDEAAIWNSVLSEGTIEAIYNTTNDSDTGQVADLSETPEGAPVAWYRFE